MFRAFLTLPCPIGLRRHPAQVAFSHRRTAFLGGWQVEHLLLDIRCQKKQVEDLGDSCAGDAEEAGQFGVVLDGS